MGASAVPGGTDVLLGRHYSHGGRVNFNAYEKLSESASIDIGMIAKPFTAAVPSAPLGWVERIWFADGEPDSCPPSTMMQ